VEWDVEWDVERSNSGRIVEQTSVDGKNARDQRDLDKQDLDLER
jgi:hypothetical protein